MEYAIKILEEKLKETLALRDIMRRTGKRKDKGLNDVFKRWAKEATVKIKSLKNGINKLKHQ